MTTHVFRRAAIAAVLACSLSACSSSSGQPAGQSADGGGGSALVDAAAKIKDACTVMPTDLVAPLVPGGSIAPPVTPIPPSCTFTNGTSVVEITIGAHDTGGPVSGAESIPGLAAGGYLTTAAPDDAYLTVLLSPTQGAIYVEVAGHDGKDHRNDAIAIAQKVLAAIH